MLLINNDDDYDDHLIVPSMMGQHAIDSNDIDNVEIIAIMIKFFV